MIGFSDPYCPTCGGVCKCGVSEELTLATARFFDQDKALSWFVKHKVFGSKDYPNLLRWAEAQGKAYPTIARAMQQKIDQE